MSGGAQPTARRAGGGGYLVKNGAQLVLTGTFIRPPRTSLNPPLYSEWGLLFFSVAVVPNNIQKGPPSIYRLHLAMAAFKLRMPVGDEGSHGAQPPALPSCLPASDCPHSAISSRQLRSQHFYILQHRAACSFLHPQSQQQKGILLGGHPSSTKP